MSNRKYATDEMEINQKSQWKEITIIKKKGNEYCHAYDNYNCWLRLNTLRLHYFTPYK